jgi:hypothetical protein
MTKIESIGHNRNPIQILALFSKIEKIDDLRKLNLSKDEFLLILSSRILPKNSFELDQLKLCIFGLENDLINTTDLENLFETSSDLINLKLLKKLLKKYSGSNKISFTRENLFQIVNSKAELSENDIDTIAEFVNEDPSCINQIDSEVSLKTCTYGPRNKLPENVGSLSTILYAMYEYGKYKDLIKVDELNIGLFIYCQLLYKKVKNNFGLALLFHLAVRVATERNDKQGKLLAISHWAEFCVDHYKNVLDDIDNQYFKNQILNKSITDEERKYFEEKYNRVKSNYSKK